MGSIDSSDTHSPRTRCAVFFEMWCNYLEREPGLWMVRDMYRNVIWQNPEMREFIDENYPTTKRKMSAPKDYADAIRWVRMEDAMALEDCYSRAMKTGRPQWLTLGIKLLPHKASFFSNIYYPVWCNGKAPGCPYRRGEATCCLVLVNVEPHAKTTDGASSSPTSSHQTPS